MDLDSFAVRTIRGSNADNHFFCELRDCEARICQWLAADSCKSTAFFVCRPAFGFALMDHRIDKGKIDVTS